MLHDKMRCLTPYTYQFTDVRIYCKTGGRIQLPADNVPYVELNDLPYSFTVTQKSRQP